MEWRQVGAGIAAAGTLAGGGTVAIDQAVINPYDDKGTHYELSVKADIEQGERVEISKREPKVDLVFWNDEERVTIKPLFPDAAREEKSTANRPLLSKQMQFKKGDRTAFVVPKEGSDSEFDIDFTLDAKPESNVFEYSIEGADDLDFFYQPELTPEEIEGGAYRPDNVVGSYAVYHKTKANHRVGDTNYATGKAFHIYRPKAIDASGAEVWAELHYSDGILSVTVPPKWLETAAYPVIVDPTFGYSSIGGTNGNDTGTTLYFQATPSTSGLITNLSIYCNWNFSGSSASQGALYSDTSSNPNVRLAVASGMTACQSASPNWQSGTLSYFVTGSTPYHFGFYNGSGNIRYYWDTGLGGVSNTNTGFVALPTTATAAGTNTGRTYSVYATYSECTSSPCTQSLSTTGYNTWTAPTGVTSVIAACWGSGGGSASNTTGGGGGGGGSFASSTLAVTPGATYGLWIGAGGAIDSAVWARESSFATSSCPNCVIASGGGGTTNNTAGAAGPTASSTGTTKFAGGTGGKGHASGGGGGGGGAAGPHGVGANGTNSSGGQGASGGRGDNTLGGVGGTGGTGAGPAGTSNALGGGGGAGGAASFTGGTPGAPGAGGGGSGGTSTGKAGAAGQCTLTYTISAGGGGDPVPFNSDLIWFE